MTVTKIPTPEFKHVLSIADYTPGDLFKTIIPICCSYVEKVRKTRKGGGRIPDESHHLGVVAILEESTRTRTSYEEAFRLMGWSARNIYKYSTSLGKKESLADTFRMHAANGASLIAIRSDIEGLPRFIAEIFEKGGLEIPIHNAGDGANQHPTQTLLDLVTIKRFLNRFDDLTIGLIGDLGNARTVNSLCLALSYCKNIKLRILSHPLLALRPEIKQLFTDVQEVGSYEELGSHNCQFVYMSRVQTNRRDYTEKQLAEFRNIFQLNARTIEMLGKDVFIMHPLPAAEGDFHPEIRNDPRLIVDKQAAMGAPTRMALAELSMKHYQAKTAIPNISGVEIEEIVREDIETRLKRREQEKGANYTRFYPISSGTIIDHIPKCLMFRVREFLIKTGVLDNCGARSWNENVRSRTAEEKEVIVLTDGFLPDKAMLELGKIAPMLTFNVMNNGIFSKRRMKELTLIRGGIGTCPNLKCVTRNEPEAVATFHHIKGGVRCHYCERHYGYHELI